MCFKYIWKTRTNSKKVIEKIKRSVMCMDTDEGGASMIKLADQQSVFLLKWVKRTALLQNSLLNSTNISNLYFSWFGNNEYFLDFSCQEEDLIFPRFYSRFWKDVLCCYIRNKDGILLAINNNVKNQKPIEASFFNKKVTHRNKVLFFRPWIKAGLKYTNQVRNDSILKSYGEIS